MSNNKTFSTTSLSSSSSSSASKALNNTQISRCKWWLQHLGKSQLEQLIEADPEIRIPLEAFFHKLQKEAQQNQNDHAISKGLAELDAEMLLHEKTLPSWKKHLGAYEATFGSSKEEEEEKDEKEVKKSKKRKHEESEDDNDEDDEDADQVKSNPKQKKTSDESESEVTSSEDQDEEDDADDKQEDEEKKKPKKRACETLSEVLTHMPSSEEVYWANGKKCFHYIKKCGRATTLHKVTLEFLKDKHKDMKECPTCNTVPPQYRETWHELSKAQKRRAYFERSDIKEKGNAQKRAKYAKDREEDPEHFRDTINENAKPTNKRRYEDPNGKRQKWLAEEKERIKGYQRKSDQREERKEARREREKSKKTKMVRKQYAATHPRTEGNENYHSERYQKRKEKRQKEGTDKEYDLKNKQGGQRYREKQKKDKDEEDHEQLFQKNDPMFDASDFVGVNDDKKEKNNDHANVDEINSELQLQEESFYSKKSKVKRSAIERDLAYDLDDVQLRAAFITPCFYCGQPCTHSNYSAPDRISSQKGYLKDNITPCCTICNMMKGEKEIREFVLLLRNIVLYSTNSVSDEEMKKCHQHFLRLKTRPYNACNYAKLCISAKQRKIECTLTQSEWKLVIENEKCVWCGIPEVLMSLGADRIDNDKGYELGNIQASCVACNLTRNTATQNDFLLQVKKIVQHLGALSLDSLASAASSYYQCALQAYEAQMNPDATALLKVSKKRKSPEAKVVEDEKATLQVYVSNSTTCKRYHGRNDCEFIVDTNPRAKADQTIKLVAWSPILQKKYCRKCIRFISQAQKDADDALVIKKQDARNQRLSSLSDSSSSTSSSSATLSSSSSTSSSSTTLSSSSSSSCSSVTLSSSSSSSSSFRDVVVVDDD